MLLSIILLFVSILLSRSHQHWWEKSEVQELTTGNFYDYVGRSQHVIVEFYTPWCVYCQAMFQNYEELKRLYSGDNPKRRDVLIAKLNGQAHEHIIHTYGVYSYPTIVHFPPGAREFNAVFQQQRTADVMSNWIENICGPEKKPEEEKKEEVIVPQEEEVIVPQQEEAPTMEKPEDKPEEPLETKIEEPIREAKVEIKEVKKEASKPSSKPEGKRRKTTYKIPDTEESPENRAEGSREVDPDPRFDERRLAEERKAVDILITLSDELKFLEKTNREASDRLFAEIVSLRSQINTPEEIPKPFSGVNIKHASVFFMLGVLLGLALACTIVKFRRLSHVLPTKGV